MDLLSTPLFRKALILLAGWGLLTLWFLVYEWSTGRGYFAVAEDASDAPENDGSEPAQNSGS